MKSMAERVRWVLAAGLTTAVVGLGAAACGGDDLYGACEEAADCDAPDGQDAACIPKNDQGYCSWFCSDDADCAESNDEYERVCAPFEDTGDRYCFPRCEADEACPEGYSCRSTGGGSANRKVCFPGE